MAAGEREADAKSLLSVLALGAKAGTTLRLTADGDDAARALDALRELRRRRSAERAGQRRESAADLARVSARPQRRARELGAVRA